MRYSVLIILFCASHLTVFGQTHHRVGVFPTVDLKYKFSSKFEIESYSFLSYFPTSNTLNNIDYPASAGVLYTELDFTYNLSESFGLTASYTYERANPFESNYRNENRFWLQATLKSKVNKLDIKNRIRYDFRFIQNRATNQTDYLPRLRYLIGLSYPLQKKERPTTFTLYNEAFFNTFKGSSPFYTENWAFIGFNIPLTEKLAIEPGYLNISWIRDPQQNWLMQHFGQITIYVSLN